MPTFECIQCKYQTTRRNDYTKHLETNSHQELMHRDVSLLCECCNKVFATKNRLERHKTSNKYIQYLNNKTLTAEIQKLSKKIDKQEQKLSKKIDKQNISTQNISTKITKYNRSVMRVLKEDYSNNPALEELGKDEIILAFEQHYKEKYVEPITSENETKLQKKIISDFENNKLMDVIGKVILQFTKKETKEHQSVFNTDFSRNNYATKTKENWLNDKLGLKYKEYILKPIITTINKIITTYDYYLIKCIKNDEIDNRIYNQIVDIKIKLFDFIEYVNEPKKQEQIIYKISPQLQLEYAS